MEEENNDEMIPDLKNDIQIAFNIFKNDNNKITKLKLRTMLFSFAMYKSAPGDINQFIEQRTSPEQEQFTFEEVCKLINSRNNFAKQKEADDIYNTLTQQGKNELNNVMLKEAFDENQINVSMKEVCEMMKFMGAENLYPGEDYDEDFKEPKVQKTKTRGKEEVKIKIKPRFAVKKENFQQFYVDVK